jgi:hypothetical protein
MGMQRKNKKETIFDGILTTNKMLFEMGYNWFRKCVQGGSRCEENAAKISTTYFEDYLLHKNKIAQIVFRQFSN